MLSVLDSNAWKILPCGEAQRRFARRIFFGNAMRSHIEMQTQEHIDAGMNPEEARYAAFRQFGWVESIKEACREPRGVNWIEHLIQVEPVNKLGKE